MALSDLLQDNNSGRKIGVSEERLRACIPIARKYIAFWRKYPDLMVDKLVKWSGSNFEFYFFQRVFLRACARHKYNFDTFPRGYSKSFLTTLWNLCACVLYPGTRPFIAAGGKAQSAGIVAEKVEQLCTLIRAFDNEIDRRPGKGTTVGKDYVKYQLKNGSIYDNVACNEKSRGKRRIQGTIEEVVGVDGKILSEVLIPMTNIARRAANGETRHSEIINQSMTYVTTAGWKNTFCYDKLIQTLVGQVINPDKYLVLGGSWKIPVLMKLYNKNFINELKADGTFNESSFEREYCSVWSGGGEDAFFSGEHFERNRKLAIPEYESQIKAAAKSGSYYVLAADIGRFRCDTVVCVFKVNPQPQGLPTVHLVNIYTYSDIHLEDQILEFKKLFYLYKARAFVIDGNGIGAGYVDMMVKSQDDKKTGEHYPDFGVINDENGEYKKYKTDETELDALYIIKANAAINTEAYSTAQSMMSSNKVKFLIDPQTAKLKLLRTDMGKNMRPEERATFLVPFTRTSALKDELLNLKQENEGINIILKQITKKIPKDKVSAFVYGLLYIKRTEGDKKKKKRFNAKEWMLMN